jgi:DNA-binding XRE family transcriptional regulator
MGNELDTLTPEKVREIRKKTGMKQEAFWSEVGFSLQQGSNFERGRFNQNNRHLRLMVFMRFVLGIPVMDTHSLRELKQMADFGRSAAAAVANHKDTGEKT